jgi:cytochrome c2
VRIRTLAGAVLACTSLHGCAPAADEGRRIERGQRLLAHYQCGACHSIPEVTAARGRIGPPLERWAGRSYIAGHLPNRADTLARWIAEPQALVPGTAMPDMGVSDVDARAMAAYLMSLE